MKLLLTLLLSILVALTTAQLHDSKIKPKSLTQPVSKSMHTIVLPKVDIAKSMREEKEEIAQQKEVAPRFGIPIKLKRELGLDNAGTYETLNDGSRIWRIKFISKGAFFTMASFSKFNLKKGSTLHIIQKDGKFLGAFNHENNVEKEFGVGPIHGDSLILELYEPSHLVGTSTLSLKSITHAYKNLFNDRSGWCNINVHCHKDEGWNGHFAAVGLMLSSSGFRFCTGSLVNDATKKISGKFLTAAHCGLNPRGWVIVFNYQGETCERGSPSRTTDTLGGLTSLASHRTSDFHLLEFDKNQFKKAGKEYNLFLAGYSAVDEPEMNFSVAIHHPRGDNKKISFAVRQLRHDRWGSGPMGTHWRVRKWTNGTTEPGSSGSPLYDSNKRIVGQLHGGTASCSNLGGWDSYGKIAASWDIGNTPSSRLKDHLDPEGSDQRLTEGVWVKDQLN